MIQPVRTKAVTRDLPEWMPAYVLRAEKIGGGAEGDVWIAHSADGTTVIKRFFAEHHQSLHRELALIGVAASTPNLRRILDVEITSTGDWLVRLEYCSGGSLRDLLNQQQRFSIPRACDLVEQLAAGLTAIHEIGYIHGDVKPENILIHRQIGPPVYKLCDFGQVMHVSDAPRRLSLLSKEYAAPERYDGIVSPAMDLYALGIIWYELLTGFRIRSAEELDVALVGREMVEAITPLLGHAANRPSAAAVRHTAAENRAISSAERYFADAGVPLQFITDDYEDSI